MKKVLFLFFALLGFSIHANAVCTSTSTAVDAFYTNANPQFAVSSLQQGYTWSAETTAAGVKITMQFLDNLPGMATPMLFTFDAQGVLIGNPIPMAEWNPTTRTAAHTLTGLEQGSDLVFLVQVALEAGKILFTERIIYTVGSNCDGSDATDNVVAECSGNSKGVDEYYTAANPAAAGSDAFTMGYDWSVKTMQSGNVEIEVNFLDYFPGMAAPQLFLFKNEGGNEVLDGDPIPMRWVGTKARYTLTGLTQGTEIVFLVQLAYEMHVLFTERIRYTVGSDCNSMSDDDPVVGSCSGKSKGVDEYYTSNNAAAATSADLTNGYQWTVATRQSGNVDIELEFLDYLPGIAAPQLFLFKNEGGNEVLDGDPIPMRWMGLTASYTLENQTTGTELVFLVQVAYEMHVLFTERIRYTVGNNCQEDTALEQPSVTTTARKVIEIGQIYIIHNGIRYNDLGAQIK